MRSKFLHKPLVILCALTLGLSGAAQNLLNRNVSLNVSHQRLDQVLEILSNKGNFYFSYNSNIIKKDSLITLLENNRTVQQLLDMLLPDHYEFRESGNYIIIRKAPIRLTIVNNKALAEDKFYTISGYVMDDETGHWIPNASIYEASLLASTLTNAEGYFKLRLKQKNKRATLTVSKEFYQDTTFTIDPGYNQQVTVTLLPLTSGALTIIGPDDYFAPEQLKLRVQKADSSIVEYAYTKTDSIRVERTRVGQFLVNSRQRAQSMNLRRFFTSRPFQLSMTPGLGTHGSLSAQVVNNFSINLLGGYNGGVNGVEFGGLFNIDKKSVRYVQAAGLFNIVGGQMTGFQIAGITNTVLDNARGFQMAGINNMVKGRFTGLQLAGIYNHVTDSVKGTQVAGVANFVRNKISGSQIAGVINYAKHVKGTQIGLINISDTSEGLGIGLINIVMKGYHKLAFYSDELIHVNAAFKTGSRKLYNILQAGMNFSDSNKIYSVGYGLGTELQMGKLFSINPELTAQQLYLGSFDYTNILSKLKLNLNLKLGKYVTVFGGPVANVYYSDQDVKFSSYRSAVPPSGSQTYKFNTKVKGWLGWNAGISFF